MKVGAPGPFGAQLKALREAAGFTQEELATISGLSVHAVSALERGERRRPHVETVRALSAALDLTGRTLNAFLGTARAPAHATVVEELSRVSLPLPPTALLGRDTEMATLRQWLSDPASRFITLIGPGGVGKTRLLLELARATGEEGATRVVFVSLAAIRDSTFVAPAIAEALGLKDISAADLAMRAHVASGDQRTLLALDNFEHVLDAASLVVDLLTSVASLRLLVTSRAPLRVRGEREFAVGPLALQPGSEEMSLADLARVPAVHLVRGTGPGCAPRISTHPGQRFDCCRNLSTARCLAACARTGRPVDQSADARGPASPPRAGCLIGGARTARSSRAPTGDERDRRLELSVARP